MASFYLHHTIFLLCGIVMAAVGVEVRHKISFARSMDDLLNVEGFELFQQVAKTRHWQKLEDSKADLTSAEITRNLLEQALGESEVLRQLYAAYKVKFGKPSSRSRTYAQNPNRMEIFRDTIIAVANHNLDAREGKFTYEQGINGFSDLTFTEFVSQYTGYNPNPTAAKFGTNGPNSKPKSPQGSKKYYKQSENNFMTISKTAAIGEGTDIVNWAAHESMSPIKDQGPCGSCVFFGTIALLEWKHFMMNKEIADLTEQELLDCAGRANSKWYGACNGNHPELGFLFMKNYGLGYESDYPYKAYNKTCTADNYTHINPMDYKKISIADDKATKEHLIQSPIAIGVEVTNQFGRYRSGILDDDECQGILNHMVLLVGYGTDAEGVDYWIIKNSWSSKWGDEGYIRLRQKCGVNKQHSIMSDFGYIMP